MKSAKPLSLRDSVIDKLETNFIDETGKTHEQIRYFFQIAKGVHVKDWYYSIREKLNARSWSLIIG